MKDGNIIGEPFDDYVKEQISLRQEIYGRGEGSTLLTSEDLQYINGNSAWIKMASSVSINPISSPTGSINDLNSNQLHSYSAIQLHNVTNKIDNDIYYSGEDKLRKIGLATDQFVGTLLAEKSILFGGLILENFLSKAGTPTTQTLTYPPVDPSFGGLDGSGGNTKFFPLPKSITKTPIDNSFLDNNNIIRKGITKSNEIWNEGAAYGLGGKEFGINPMPGITSLNVEHLNRGSIRKATVRIRAHNRFQFELIELLYIRLGFTMILEWGESKYPAQSQFDGKIIYEDMGNTFIENEWFSTTGQNFYSVLEKLENLRSTYKGNYGGFIGRVINFDWNFNTDGSYDITLNLVSIGDVIESLKINILSDPISPETENDEENNNDISNWLLYLESNPENFYTQWFTFHLGIIKKDFVDIKGLEFKKSNFPEDNGGKSYPLIILSKETTKVVIKTRSQDIHEKGEGIILGHYIKLGTFLEFLEEKILLNIENEGIKPFPIFKIDTGVERNIMSININQFSIDPRICIVKTNYFDVPLDTKNFFGDKMDSFYSSTPSPHGRIMNIYLNFDFINKILKRSITEKHDLKFYEFIESILEGINGAFGGISNLEAILYENTNTLKIIDQNNIPNKKLFFAPDSSPSEPLEIFGFNTETNQSNFVKEFSVNTKITPELSTMLTVGATANGQIVGEEATAFSHWNRGLTDRFNQYISNPGVGKELKTHNKNKPKDSLGFIESTIFATYANYGFVEKGKKVITLKREKEKQKEIREKSYIKYIDDAFNEKRHYKPRYLEFDEDFINRGFNNLKNSIIDIKKTSHSILPTSTTTGFIPISLNITLRGISGIKIYNSIEVNTKFLPQNYPKVMEFIIIKVNHKLENNEWTTELETISIPKLEIPKKQTIPHKNIDLRFFPPPESEWWALVAVCAAENYPHHGQGMADTAQSIYNRKTSGYFEGSIFKNLTSGNYAVTEHNIKDWKNIIDIDTAIHAYSNFKGAIVLKARQHIISCDKALKNDEYKKEAARFVGSRTDFLSGKPTSIHALGVIERMPESKNNAFFWRYEGKNYFYKKGIYEAVESNVNIEYIQNIK